MPPSLWPAAAAAAAGATSAAGAPNAGPARRPKLIRAPRTVV